jgi:hypothetical protein
MDNEQFTHISTSLGRIEQKIDSHLEEDRIVHDRHNRAIEQNTLVGQANGKQIARIKGIGTGAGTLMALLLSAIGLDRFGG